MPKVHPLLFSLVLCLCPAVAQDRGIPPDPQEFYEDLEQARRHMDEGDFVEARSLFDSLVRRAPKNASLRYQLGMCHWQTGQPREAVQNLTAALEMGMGTPPLVSYWIAGLHANLGEAEVALDWLSRALEFRYVNRAGVATDASFSSLREEARFKELAGLLPEREFTREQGWSYDLDFLLAEIRRMHPLPGGHPDGSPVQSAIEDLNRRVTDLDDTQVTFELLKIIGLLGDGHSGVRLSSAQRLDLTYVPVQFHMFSDGLFIIRGRGAGAALVGARVLTLGGRSVEEVMEIMAEVVPHENDQGIVANAMNLLRIPGLLHHFEVSPSRESLTLTVESPGGVQRRIELEGGERLAFPRFDAPEEASTPAPPYLQRKQESWWDEPRGPKAHFVQFNGVRDDPGKTLKQYVGELHQRLQSSGAQNVIVDVRHNGGGNNFLVKPMIRALVHFEMDRPGNRVFVITSRYTYSACQNFLNRLEQIGDPIVVGEPSSSKPNFIGETTHTRLPWSGIRVGISSRYWQDSYPEDSRVWIAPDIPTPLSSEDWFANRDPAMSAVLAVING